MKRSEIEAASLVERYWQGTLSPEEEHRFEERFLDDPELLDRLESERRFRLGFKDMAVEDALRTSATLGFFAMLSRFARRPGVGWAVALLVVVLGLPATYYLGKSPTADGPAAAPLVDVPLYNLVAPREGEMAVNVVSSTRWSSLAIDLHQSPGFESFAVTIESKDRPIFERRGLTPNSLDLLLLTFPPDFFAPGEYRLQLEAIPLDGGTAELLSSYLFLVR